MKRFKEKSVSIDFIQKMTKECSKMFQTLHDVCEYFHQKSKKLDGFKNEVMSSKNNCDDQKGKKRGRPKKNNEDKQSQKKKSP